MNSTNTVISAQDYDAWGYPLENRTYNSSAMRYDFTGKERDDETSYDYFGARYYDSRIGRWGGVEPIYDKFLSFSPYIYSICNPIILRDFNGKDITVVNLGDKKDDFLKDLKKITGLDVSVKDGKLTYDKEAMQKGKLKGSKDARKLLIDAIEANTNINLEIVSEGASYTEKGNIYLSSSQITGFMQSARVNNLNESTMGWGLTLMHELYHSFKGYEGDPETFDEGMGDIEPFINEMRKQLGEDYGERITYRALSLTGKEGSYFIPMNKDTHKALIEARNNEQPYYAKPGHQFIEYK